jgi:hypothetical protein
MSHREIRRRRRPSRHLCAACQQRKAKFQHQGHIRADSDHVLCFQCFRTQREQIRARQLNGTVPLYFEMRRPAPFRPALTLPEIEHRRRMLAHQESLTAYASR